MASFQDRVIGALRLQPATFEDVEADTSATAQAVAVVALGGLAGAIASGFDVTRILTLIIVQLIGWAIGAWVLLMVGTKLLPGKNTQADLGQMLRTAGFAQAPGLFNVLSIVPVLGLLVPLLTAIWILVALVIAVRQALDYDDTTRAIVVCIVAWVIMILVTMVLSLLGFGAAVVSSSMM